MQATRLAGAVATRRRRSVWLALVAPATGCAGLHPHIARLTATHVYAGPCSPVVQRVRETLEDHEFDPREVPAAGGLALETPWRRRTFARTGDGPRGVRYLAHAEPAGAAGCRITLVRETSGIEGVASARDLELEWEVLSRVDPQAARRIERESQGTDAMSTAE
jgi:hypothetical protein